MGRCIICGAAVDGRICDTHEEDVVFRFRGSNPNQLTPDRYYEGTVDGYADFGVFVDVGDHVTGLLHESEIDRRLEGLDWEPGDTVYVQVLRVRDNGNVDLGWSIRQRESDFRGVLVEDPDADEPERLPEESDTLPNGGDTAGARPATPDPQPVEGAGSEPTAESDEGAGSEPTAESDEGAEDDAESTDESAGEASAGTAEEPTAEAPERVAVETLGDSVGDRVTLEGEVVGVRQTGGPTVFEVRDETGAVDVAAFAGAGVRAYPEIETDDLVRVVGEVEVRRDELQVESETVEVLAGEDATAVRQRLAAALAEEARPDDVELLADHGAVAAVREQLLDAAEAVRRAVLETRPVVVRHTATADGHVAGAAIERAVLPLVREEHARSDAEYHYFDRRPLEEPVYGMGDATRDVTDMLEGRDRHDEKLPLLVLVDVGGAADSAEGLELLDVYGVERVAVDPGPVVDDVAAQVSTVVSPPVESGDAADVTATALAADLAAAVDPGVREDLAHLPAVSYWEDAPGAYVDIASGAGYDADDVRELREAVALEAYYQTYEDKRELITDLLFGDPGASATPLEAADGAAGTTAGSRPRSGDGEDPEGDARGLAAHVSEQFREKLDTAVETARANVAVRERDGVRLTVLDADAFAHRFDFPPTYLLADELHRRERDGPPVTMVLTRDELYLRDDHGLDVRDVAATVDAAVDDAGVRAIGGRDGRLQFLAGEREAVLEATVDAVADAL